MPPWEIVFICVVSFSEELSFRLVISALALTEYLGYLR